MEVVKTELLVRQLGKDNARVVIKWLETALWELKNKIVDVEEDEATLIHKWKARQVRQLAAELRGFVDAG